MICPKQALSLSGGHWGEGSHIPGYFVVTLDLTTRAGCILPPFYTSPLPCTWTFHPLISDSQMGLDCLIRESRHRVISSYLSGSNCTRAAARPEICAPLILLGPLSRSFSLPALDSRKGKGKFCLQGSSNLLIVFIYTCIYILKTQ